MELAIAIAGGAWIFIGVIIAFILAVIYGLYTVGGSGISEHPYGGREAPGAKIPATLGSDRVVTRAWSRGTR